MPPTGPAGIRTARHVGPIGNHLASWTFGEPHAWPTPELLPAEVRGAIDELNGRPDPTGRCLAAVDVGDRAEDDRAAALAADLAIPETMRHYALGDMDRKAGQGEAGACSRRCGIAAGPLPARPRSRTRSHTEGATSTL
ncbi:hypothetical protein [Streptomyces sp. NPDC020817]|uniref:DUF7639 domain-containing protein n=1 Tax=Streptomyces sp. NPDC020817 TaxID=3365095 RepID=UPI0037A85EE6